MKIILLTLIVLAAGCSTTSDNSGITHATLWKLNRQEAAGITFYKNGNYEKAYANLSITAEKGFKQAQYLLGFMYLKGQHVEQSTKTGLAWIGVANEAEIKDWHQSYSDVYKMLTKEQKDAVEKRTEIFIQKYGLKAQGVECETRGTLTSMKRDVHCRKLDDSVAPIYQT